MTRRQRTPVVLALLFVPLVAAAQDPATVFDQANKLYLEQKYSQAIQYYESILKSGYESGEIYFNLGNAYYKTSDIQHALLNYERAKKFLPGDDDLAVNLQLSNLQVVDKIDPIPQLFLYRWSEHLLGVFRISTLGWIAYLFFIITLVVFSYFLMARAYERKRYSLMASFLFGALFIVTTASYFMQSYHESNTKYGIVMADVSNIKSAPDRQGADLFVLHKGLKVQVLDSVNKWKKIRLADGKVGWIPEDECEII